MPELPEVESVVRALREAVCGDVIRGVRILRPQLLRSMSAARFRAGVGSRRIVSVRRRGKFILMELTGRRLLLTHLRMTGRFFYGRFAHQLPSAARVVFLLETGHLLAYCDQRNLGVMKLVPARDLGRLKELQQLGLEPLQPEFTPDRLGHGLARCRRSIKEALLDQTKVVGLGNIYAVEALHRAGISPRRQAAAVVKSKKRLHSLHQSIVLTLREAVAAQQSGMPLYFEIMGGDGESDCPEPTDIEFRVYDREGDPCLTCGVPIKRIKQGGRSTYYCPSCQR